MSEKPAGGALRFEACRIAGILMACEEGFAFSGFEV